MRMERSKRAVELAQSVAAVAYRSAEAVRVVAPGAQARAVAAEEAVVQADA